MVDYTIPTYSRPDLGFKVSDYVTKYYKDKEEKEAEEEETIVAEGQQQKYKADGKEYATWGQAEHARMYPGHQALANKAGFSGLFGPNAARPGNKSYDAMIDARKQDMIDIGLDLTHTIDGKRPNGWPVGHAKSNLSGKYSSDDFTTWMDLTGGVVGSKKNTTDTIPQTASTDTTTTTPGILEYDVAAGYKSYDDAMNQAAKRTALAGGVPWGSDYANRIGALSTQNNAWNNIAPAIHANLTGMPDFANIATDPTIVNANTGSVWGDYMDEAAGGGLVDVDLDADFDANQGFYE